MRATSLQATFKCAAVEGETNRNSQGYVITLELFRNLQPLRKRQLPGAIYSVPRIVLLVSWKLQYGTSGTQKGGDMLLSITALIVILAFLGSLPSWPHSRDWGYYPGGGISLVLFILLIVFCIGRL